MIINPEVFHEISQARLKAHAKHSDNSIESLPPGDSRWLPILVEEIGEVSHELTYDSAGSLRAELIDVLAVASAWVDAIDRSAWSERDALARIPTDPAFDTDRHE